MDRLLSCECGREHIVAPSQAGQEIKCDCGKIVAVPTLRGLSKLPLATQAPTADYNTPASGASLTAGSGTNRAWQGWRGPAIAVASAGFFIALAACCWYSLQRLNIDTSYTVAQEIEAGNEMLDSYDANLLSNVWHGFGKMGLRSKEPPVFFMWNIYAQDRTRRALISGGIAATFAAIALGIGLSARRKRVASSE